MNFKRLLVACVVLLACWAAAENGAWACITGAACGGGTPVCDLLSFSCRACASDLDCGAPLSGDVCVKSGAQAGACVSAGDAGTRTCTMDAQCDTLGGYVCSGVACVLGCHVTVLGDTCIVGAHCTFPVDVSITIGACMSGAAPGDGGAVSPGDGGSRTDGGVPADASTPGCTTDLDCLATGRVCVATPTGAACVAGCHDTAAGDTCPEGTTCSVAGGGLGVCFAQTSDGGPTTCALDTDCGKPGLVCSSSLCVIGCHERDGGVDSCPSGATCSVGGGGLGVCLPVSDGGGEPECISDADCHGGLVCVGSTCVVGCHRSDLSSAPDTCLAGGTCSVVDASFGHCIGGDGGSTPSCTQDTDCSPGLVCDETVCVVGCHDTATAGDTCVAASHCSVVGGGLGACVGEGADGGTMTCATDPQCPAGQVCERGQCVVGCHDAPPADDTCASGARCDVLGGSLGVCIEGGDAGDGAADASRDATSADGAPGTSAGDGGDYVPSLEGGGCDCSTAPNTPAEGAGLGLLLALTLLARRRFSK